MDTKVTKFGDCDQRINTRINKASQAFTMLKPVWRTSKIKIFKSNVLSILQYGAECWKTTVTIQRKLDVFQTKCLQHILKVYWPNTISNEELRNRTEMDTLAEIIQTLRCWRLGNVCHVPSNSITRTDLRSRERGDDQERHGSSSRPS